jgi:hypothetical protein
LFNPDPECFMRRYDTCAVYTYEIACCKASGAIQDAAQRNAAWLV